MYNSTVVDDTFGKYANGCQQQVCRFDEVSCTVGFIHYVFTCTHIPFSQSLLLCKLYANILVLLPCALATAEQADMASVALLRRKLRQSSCDCLVSFLGGNITCAQATASDSHFVL